MKANILGLILLSSLFSMSAFAQSSMRADELIKSPEQYRLGDSNDLEKDELIVEQNKICDYGNSDKIQKHQKNIMQKHLLKHSDHI